MECFWVCLTLITAYFLPMAQAEAQSPKCCATISGSFPDEQAVGDPGKSFHVPISNAHLSCSYEGNFNNICGVYGLKGTVGCGTLSTTGGYACSG